MVGSPSRANNSFYQTSFLIEEGQYPGTEAASALQSLDNNEI